MYLCARIWVTYCYIRLVKFLVEEGAKVNPADRWRETPLSDALRHGHDEVAAYLKAKGGVRSAF